MAQFHFINLALPHFTKFSILARLLHSKDLNTFYTSHFLLIVIIFLLQECERLKAFYIRHAIHFIVIRDNLSLIRSGIL